MNSINHCPSSLKSGLEVSLVLRSEKDRKMGRWVEGPESRTRRTESLFSVENAGGRGGIVCCLNFRSSCPEEGKESKGGVCRGTYTTGLNTLYRWGTIPPPPIDLDRFAILVLCVWFSHKTPVSSSPSVVTDG